MKYWTLDRVVRGPSPAHRLAKPGQHSMCSWSSTGPRVPLSASGVQLLQVRYLLNMVGMFALHMNIWVYGLKAMPHSWRLQLVYSLLVEMSLLAIPHCFVSSEFQLQCFHMITSYSLLDYIFLNVQSRGIWQVKNFTYFTKFLALGVSYHTIPISPRAARSWL